LLWLLLSSSLLLLLLLLLAESVSIVVKSQLLLMLLLYDRSKEAKNSVSSFNEAAGFARKCRLDPAR